MNTFDEEYTPLSQEEELFIKEAICEKTEPPEPKFYSLLSIITFIILPPLWCFSVPALVFSSEAKHFYSLEQFDVYLRFSDKAKKFNVAAWAIFATLSLAFFAIYAISRLSLI